MKITLNRMIALCHQHDHFETPALMNLLRAVAQEAEASEPVRDRESDRQRFPDIEFNRWLDEGISDAGHTVWDSLNDVCDAWHGWNNRQYYPTTPQPAAPGPFTLAGVAAFNKSEAEKQYERANVAEERCADQKFKLAEYDRAFVEQEQQIASDKLLLDECEEVATGVIEAWDGISYAFRKNKYNGLKELLTKLAARKSGA